MKFQFAYLLCVLFLITSCNQQAKEVTNSAATEMNDRAAAATQQVPKYQYAPPAVEGEITPFDSSSTYWAETLNDLEFRVLREDGTERSFTGDLWNNKRAGIYTCRGCGLPLYSSDTKFKSGTGWPSFYEPIHPNYIKEEVDNRYGMQRVEVSCARCGGHQGHVFPDGPQPTGMRHCINSVSLDFVPVEDIQP